MKYRICDICEQTVMIASGGQTYEEVGELNATWGYGSKQDGNMSHLDLCECCFTVALEALKGYKKSKIVPGENLTALDKNFGLDLKRSS